MIKIMMTSDRRRKTDNIGNENGTVTLTVPSHPKYLYVVRSALYPILTDAGFGRKDSRRIILAVDEACSNIIKHAYDGDTTKTITMTITEDADRFTVRLRDYGRKADPAKIAPRDLADVRPGGLGTVFIGAAFDSVTYDTNQEQGTLLILEKKKKRVNV
jgi:anti-sigma regulatory factor (Ser/Thr protein kinase)